MRGRGGRRQETMGTMAMEVMEKRGVHVRESGQSSFSGGTEINLLKVYSSWRMQH